ncbi:MAG TPA: FAD-dependent oxidoreductase, partial [Kineosporiaceae bacterium]|nr:FAD-dependent oxidoreductase [Kineosporiaceae bacterium]
MVANFPTETRRKALQRMADEELDVLVIGGGITGSGIALDAASRGFTVAVVERDDFAAGASGRSSRMVHGGLRYLEQREVRLVRESLQERSRLMRLAPHLVRPIPMYAPIATASERRRWRTALTAYDALAVGSTIRRHYTRSVSTVARAIPGLGNPTPALVYHECATDDARLTLEVARAAQAAGALVANHADVQALRGAGRVRGAIVVDRQTGEQLEVAARVTVNAGGVWAAHVQGLATATPVELRPSKGVHLVFRPGAVTTRVGVVIPSGAGDGRHLFVLPWGDRSFAGTTDTPYQGTFDDLRVTAA